MKLTVEVASYVDRDEPATELWGDNEMWGEIENTPHSFTLVVYPRASGKPWRFDLADFEVFVRELVQETHGVYADSPQQT